jgi:DNA-binding GntR family transcriptional regulator
MRAERVRARAPVVRSSHVVRQSAGNLVSEYVRREIFEGRLHPGDKIPQGDIADALGLSRIPVREAIVALERDGVVTISPHRGAFVTALDAGAIEDHYELYGLLYGHAARRAAKRASSADREELAAVRDMLPAGDDPQGMLVIASRLRDALQRAGGSPRLHALMASLAGMVPGNFFEVIPGSVLVARHWIPVVVKAILAGDADEAAVSCLSMMRAHGRNVIGFLTERGVLSATEPTRE